MATELFANNFATQLATGVAPGDLTIQVQNAAPSTLWGGQFRIVIDQEYMIVTAGQGGTTWTVTRNAEPGGSGAVAHQQGGWVTHTVTAGVLASFGPTFTGIVYAHTAHGIALNSDGTVDGNQDSPSAMYRIGMGITCVNGVNGGRGGSPNSITVDTANGAGSSFFNGFYANATFSTEGTLTQYAGYLVMNESTDATMPAYNEGLVFFGAITANRQGAFAAPIETNLTINPGKQARGAAASFVVGENNSLASYAAVVGSSSTWSVTGTRGVRITDNSTGGGTGLFVEGAWAGAAMTVSLGNALTGVPSLQVFNGAPRSDTNNQPVLALTGNKLAMGAGGTSATDTNLYRVAAGVLKTDSNLQVAAALAVLGSFWFHRTTVADVNYAIQALDHLIAYTSLTTGRTATLPSAAGVTGQTYIVKDETGSANTNNITIATTSAQTIDGSATKVINTANGIARVYSNGANWFTY